MSHAPAFRRASGHVEDLPEVTRLTRGRRANRYPGPCAKCKKTVQGGEGIAYLPEEQGSWVVEHTECPMIEPEAFAPKPDEASASATTGQTYEGVRPGTYTMTYPAGHSRTFKVRVQSSDDAFAPGEAIISVLSGPDNTRDFTSFGFVRGNHLVAWKKFRARQESAGLLDDAQAFLADPSQARAALTCIRCHRLLTTPESIEAGLGPECRTKGW